ncbi:beta transducin [Fusarium beomiforme]|uniref:Beta transducin n=1 Tax=Fusarium beomiforme TaxID=44412 RepID=A0A9P5ASY9_9HYPO|nr:beta transducin [Fusarium beomiforme]
MRLLNVNTRQLESFFGADEDIPNYAILSHRWGPNEITFQDITQQPLFAFRTSHRQSFTKLWQCCEQAYRDNHVYVWIDTCCIDKSSSAELSEAINSMFRWYQQSDVCYVYLDDFDIYSTDKYAPVNRRERSATLDGTETSFFRSLWFTRGWTLQELIAPRNIDFFDMSWIRFGSRDSQLLGRICDRTGIWPILFQEPRCACPVGQPIPPCRDGVCVKCDGHDTLPQTLDSFAVAIKMSWASSRVTTRKEDAAYCLLGLFNLNMPMLYGEGNKAFLRLQEAIVRQSKDQSILLWCGMPWVAPQGFAPGCLAPSSAAFKDPIHILGRRVFNRVDKKYEANFLGNMPPMEISDTAIRTTLWLCPCTVEIFMPEVADSAGHSVQKLWLGIMDLAYDTDYLKRPAMLLEYMGNADMYRRVHHQLIVPIDPRQAHNVTELVTGATTQRLKITRSLDEATKKDVSILLQQSPNNATSIDPSLEGPETGPVYFLLESQTPLAMGSGGSHPPFSRYNNRTTQIPSRWAFTRCQHEGEGERYFGGIHFVNFILEARGPNSDRNPLFGYTAIIWGIHREVPKGGNASVMRLWCRVFNMHNFIECARTSTEDLHANQLYGESESLGAGEIQKRMNGQRRRLCQAGYEKLDILEAADRKELFPNSFGDDGWEEDSIDSDGIHLTAKVVLTEGLGRRVFELHIQVTQLAWS